MSTINHWNGWRAPPAGRHAGAEVRRRAQIRDASVDVVDLLDVPRAAWADLAGRALEANAFYLPDWARAVARYAEGKSGARVLLAWDSRARERLIGLLPVMSAWRTLRIPVPMFVAWHPYSPVAAPLIDRDRAGDAARGLVAAARSGGALALLLPSAPDEGPAVKALRAAVADFDAAPIAMNRQQRALLDATQDGQTAIAGLGSKKIKELRRQRNRLADGGEVAFKVARSGVEADVALDAFLALEASGWKGTKGTALASKPGDTHFIKSAMTELVATGVADIATLSSGQKVIAAGILLRHLRRSFFFKISYDENAARTSPGVQLTLDLTRRLCADAGIDDVDSTAVSGHPMIDHVWRARLAVSDWLLPVGPGRAALAFCAALVASRHRLREGARSVFHRIRSLKGK
jgi:CelD/BcsL family acetyltransferase involved in cellulose biosynthesis